MQKRKLTSWFLTICLLITQILTPDVAQAASIAFAPAQNETQSIAAWEPSALIGKVTQRILADQPKGTLIHIQDAHAVFEAQKNIQALLSEVKKVSSAENIFIEGGAGELDPQLKHFFPNGLTLSPETREAWMKEGHLTGAEAYLMENERVRGFGIEEIQSYWNNVELYRRVDARRSDTEAFLRAWYELWQKEAAKRLKPAFKKYLEVYAQAQSDAAASASWFDALRDYLKSEWDRDLGSIQEQVEFPMLTRYTYLKKIDTAPDYSKVEKQKEEFFTYVRAKAGRNAINEKVFSEINALIEKFKSNQIDLSGSREIFERLAAYLPADFSMSRWPDLKTLIEKIILAGEMDPDALLNEARRLHIQIIKKDTQHKVQRALVLLLEKQILLRKLFSLELTREDFQKILNHPAQPQELTAQLQRMSNNTPEVAGRIFGSGRSGFKSFSETYDDAIRFYHGAVARESGMKHVIQKTAQKDRVFVAVTGGFHAEGMESFAREQNWNYVALMPRISKINPEDFAHYRRALLGEGSARETPGVAEGHLPELGRAFADAVSSEVAAALITSPQAMRDPHAEGRAEAVLSLPGTEEALRRMDSHAAPRDDKNNARMKRSATRPRQSDKPMTDWEGLSRPVGRSETRLQEAIEKIRDWQLIHKDVLLQPSEADPFESLLEKEARRIYQQKKLDELSVADRTKFVQAVFGDVDAAIVQFAEGWIDKLTEEERQSALPLNYMTFSKVSRDMASIEHRYSMLQNQMIRTAGDLVFNLDSAEKRVLELEWILSQIDLELKRPGTGEIPVVFAMQDLHGGTRRALGLLAHAYGLPPDSFRRIKNLNDLIQLLDEKNMSLENLSGRIIGLNDLVDRGKDPVGSTELVARLQKTEKGRFILGNHDLWRMMGALGIHHLFNREKEEDFLKEEKGHHAAWWSWEAFHHAGWGDIELDQRNQARFNYIVEEMNAYLRDKKADDQHFAAIDLGEVRAQMDEQLKKAKSKNKKLRTDWQIQSNDEKELAAKEKRPPVEIPIPEYETLPDVFQATLAFLKEKTAAYTGRVMELRRKYPDFPGFEDFTALDLNNYDRDPEIVASVLFQLQNFRLFYIDMLGNLHMHNIIPFDQNGFKVNYKGQHGLAALELITKDIRTFFENVQAHDVVGTSASEQNAFREKMWNELGTAFEVMNEWYSDTIPIAKAQFVKKFVQEGDLSTLMGRTSGTFVDREVSGFVIWGHNELGKFADQDMSPWTFFEEFGSGILNIDGEMSQGYKDRGFLLTMGRRDANGRVSGLKLWSYPEKELGVDDSVVEEATHHLPDPIFKVRKEFEAARGALERQIEELEAGQSPRAEVETKEAELRGLQEKNESYERRYQRQQVIISKLSDGETYLKWLQFKMLKELESLLAEAAESSSLPAEKKKNFAYRRQVASNLFKSAENPLAEKITGGSATLFAQSPTVDVPFGPAEQRLHLEIHPAVSKKLEEAGVGFAPSVNEDEFEKMYPSSEDYSANQAAYEMVNQNFEQIDRFRVSHNAALADLSSSEEWSEEKAEHFFANMEGMLAANRNYTGLPENRENDKLVAQELDAKLQQLRADYLAAAVHGAGAVNQFFRQMQGIWGSVIGQQVSSIDTFNKLINFTHNRFSDRLMGGSEASRQARFMDLDHYLTRNDIAPQRARVSRFFNNRILRGLIGGPFDKSYQLIMRGSFFWLQKTLGVHKMQVYLDLSPPEFGGMGEIILYESGDDEGNILRRKLVARVLNQLGFETSEQDTQSGIGRKQLRLRAILKKNQSVKTISDLFFRMQLALYFLNTIKEGDVYLEELSLFYSPDAMEKIVNALAQRVLKTGGQFRIANNPRYLLGAVRQEKSEGGQIKEEVVPLLGHALDRRTADLPLGILTNTGGLDDHERILSAIKTGEGKWWSGAGPYEDIYQADFKKNGRKIYDAAVETLRALGLALPPDYDPAKFGQIWLHEHVNQVIQRALASGEIRKNNGRFERVVIADESVLAAPEWFLNEWGPAGATNQDINQKQMILIARQIAAGPFEPNLVGRIGSAFLYQGQMEFLDHLIDIVVARDRYGKNIAAVLYENGKRLSTDDIDQILGSVINIKEVDRAVKPEAYRTAFEAIEAPLTASVFLGEPLMGLPFLSGLKSGKAFFSAKAAHENRGILFLERAEHVDIRALESAQGLVTSTGNLLDHINTEARSYNKPRVGIHGEKIDAAAKKATLSKVIQEEVRATNSGIVYSVFKEANKANVIYEGDWVTLDGSTGMIYLLPREPHVVAGLEKLTRLQISFESNQEGAADLSTWLEQAARDENWDGIKLVLNELAMNASSYAQNFWAEVMLKIRDITDSHEDMISYWETLKNYVWVDTWQAYERHLSGMVSATRQDQLYYELSSARARLIAAEKFFKLLGNDDRETFDLSLRASKKKIRKVYFERMRLMRGKVLNALKVWDERGRPAFDGQDQNPPRFLLRRWIGQIEEFERAGFLFRNYLYSLIQPIKALFNQNQDAKAHRIKQAKEKRLLPLEEVEVGMFRFTGYKAQNLGWLTRFLNWHNKQAKTDFKIAEGTVITQAVFEEFLKQPHPSLQRPLGQLIDEMLLREDFSEKIKAFKILEWIQSTPLPSRVKSEIEQVVGKTDLWATRSSTTLEDTPTSAAAGLFQSTLSLRGIEQVEKGIKTAWASFYSEKALIYRRGLKADEDFGQGVILQKMVDADYSGVITSAGMATEDRGLVVINAGLGLGASIVDAVQDADVFTYDRITGFIQSEAGDKAEIVLPGDGGVRQVESMRSARQDEEGRAKLSLTNEQVRRMAALAMALEEAFGYVVQAEFAIKDNQIYVMQVRPMSGFKILRNERNEIDQWLRSEVRSTGSGHARSEMRQSGLNFSSKIQGHIDGRLLFAGALVLGIGLLQTILGLAAFKVVIGFVGASLVGVTFFSAFRGMYLDAKKKEKLIQNERLAELEKKHQLRSQVWTALDAWPASAKQNWIEAEESARIPDPDSITDDYARGSIHLKLAGIAFRKHLALEMNAKDISEIISHNLKLALQDFRKVDYDVSAGVLLNALEKLELESTSSSKALELFVEYFILARFRAQPHKAWADTPLPQGGYVLGKNPTQAELKNYPLPIKKNVIVFLLSGESKIAFKLKPLYRDLRKNKNNIRFVELKPQDYASREALIDKIRKSDSKKADILITPFAGLMPEKQSQYPAELQRYFEDAKDLYEIETGKQLDQIFYETEQVPALANYFVPADEKTMRISSRSLREGHVSQELRTPYSIITMLMAFVAGTLGAKRGILKNTEAPILADAFYRTGIYGDERPQQPNEASKPRRIFLVSPHPDDDVIAAKAVLAEAMRSAQNGETVAEVIVMQPGENGVVDLNETQMKEALRLALGYDTGDLNSANVAQLKKAWAKNLNEIRALHESVLAEYKERYPAAAEKFKAKLETFKGVDFEALFDAAANKAWNYEELAKSGILRMETKPETEKLLKETAKYFIRRIENQRAIDFFNDAYPGKIRAQFFPEFLGYPSSGPQNLRFIHELEEHAAVVMQHLLMKFERSMKAAPKDAVITIVAPHRVDSHPHHVGSWKVISEAMKLWSTQASRQSDRDVEVLYYFAPWSGNLPAYHLSPQAKRSTNADLLRALIAGELTASRFGLPSPKELQTMQAQRYLVRPSILPARSEARTLQSAQFDLKQYFSENERIEQIVIVTDHTRTLVNRPNHQMTEEVAAGLASLLKNKAAEVSVIVNSGDPAKVLLESHKPLHALLKDSKAHENLLMVTDAGVRRFGFDEQFNSVNQVRIPDWPFEKRAAMSRIALEAFFDELIERHQDETTSSELPLFLRDLTIDQIQAEKQRALDSHAVVSATEAIWNDARRKTPEEILVRAFVKESADVGHIYMQDQGAKMAVAADLPRDQQLGPVFFRGVEKRFFEKWSDPTIKVQAFTGGQFFDFTSVSKLDGVEVQIQDHVLSKLNPNKKTLIVILGDSGNDLLTMSSQFEMISNAVLLPILVENDFAYSELLPEHAFVGVEKHVAGTVAAIKWLNRIAGKSARETKVIELQKWKSVARSETRSRQEKSTKHFIAAAEALKRGDRGRFHSERIKLEKLGMLILAVGKSEFFPKNWKTKKPRVYTRAEREEVLRLVTAKVKHTMTPQEKRQLRMTVESQMLAIGEEEVGLIGVQNYAEDESSKFHGAHLQIVSASESSYADSFMRQTASGFVNSTQFGGAKKLQYQAQYLWWVGTEAFTAKSEKLHGGSYSEVHRFFNPDGSSYIVKTADPRKDDGKLLDEARMIQSLPEDAAAYFPKILKIIETPEKTEVWMEDLQGASLTGLINSAPGMVHMGMKEDFLSFSPFTIARQIYSLLLGVFYTRKQSETPADFAEKFHFSKLETRWSEAEALSKTFKNWMAAPYVKVSDHRRQMHLLPNFRMMLKIFRALAETYPNYFKPPYLSQQHGDLHFGNILVDIFEIISKKSISVGFKLIDPKWMKDGNDPLYDFAKLLHNLFGHYDLALDHSETHHFRTGRGKSPDAPLEMFDYLDDEASGTMEMLERVRQFEIQTWDFIRTHRGAAFPFEKDPLAWRIRLLFTEASLIAGLFKYHVVNDGREEKASILYERALTIFNDTLEMFVSFQQDRRLIPTKDKKLRKALEAMILAQNTQDEPAFVKALNEVDAIVSARSELRSAELNEKLPANFQHRNFWIDEVREIENTQEPTLIPRNAIEFPAGDTNIKRSQGYSATVFLNQEKAGHPGVIQAVDAVQSQIQKLLPDEALLVPAEGLHVTIKGIQHGIQGGLSLPLMQTFADTLRTQGNFSDTARGELVGPVWHRSLGVVMIFVPEGKDVLSEVKSEAEQILALPKEPRPFHMTLAYLPENQLSAERVREIQEKINSIPLRSIPVEFKNAEVNGYEDIAFTKVLRDPSLVIELNRSEARSIEASTELSRMSSGQARGEAQDFLDWVKTSDFIFKLRRLNQIELLVRDGVDSGEVSLASLLSPTGDGFAFGFDIPPVFHEEGATIINSGLYRALQNRLNGNDDLDALHLAGADMQRRAEIFHAKRRSGFRQGMGHVKGGSQHRQQGKNRSEIRDIPAEAQIFEKAQAEFQFRPFSTQDFKDKIGDEGLEDLIRLGVVTETAAGSKMYHLRQFDAKLGWEMQVALGALYSSSDEKLVQKWLEGIYKKERIFDQPQAKLRQASLKEIFNFMARYFRMEKYPAPVFKIFDSYTEGMSEIDFTSAIQLLERAGIGEFKTKGASAKNQPWFEFIYMPLGQLTAVRAAVQSYDVHHDEARFIQDVKAVLNPVAAPKAQPTAAVVSERDLFEDDARALLTKASGLVKSPEHRVPTGNQEPGESAQMRDARVLEVVLVIESRPQILRSVAKLVRAKAPKPLSAEMEADLVKIDTKAEQAERKKARLDQEATPMPDAIKEALAEREQAAAAALLPLVPAMAAVEPKVEVVEKAPTEEITTVKTEAVDAVVQADLGDPRLRDLPGLRKEFAARTPSDRRSLGAILKSENLDQAFIQLLTAAYRKHYGYMKKVIAEFGFTDHDQLRLLTKELGFDYKTIELEDGDLLQGVEKSQADILKLAQENDWDLPKLQGVLFGGQFYYLGDLIKGLNLAADFKSEVEKRYLAAQGRPFKDKTASFFGLKQDGFNDLVAKLKIELPQITASESSSAPALVNNPAEDHDAALKFLRANDWNITKLVAHIRELVHASGAAAETREYVDILKPLNLKAEFTAKFIERYSARYGYFAEVVKDFGLGQTDGAIRDILKMYEIDPAQIDLKRGDLLTGVGLGKNRAKAKEKLIEKINAKSENHGWGWNLPEILKWAQGYAGGRLNYLQMFKALDIRAEFEAELEATRARTQNADEAAQRFGFKNNSNLKFLLSQLKNDARSEMRGEQPSAVQVVAARLFAAGFLSPEVAVYYLNHREEFLEALPQLVSAELQKQEMEKLQSILGTDITVKDGVILSSGLVGRGFLAAAGKIFKDVPFAFIAEGEQKSEALKLIEEQGWSDQIFIADNIQHAQALLKKQGATRIQGMALAGEALLDVQEIVSFTTGQLQKFYKQAGIMGEVQHWAQIFSAFATAA